MPIPKPSGDGKQTESDFMSACMGSSSMQEYPQSQRAAICAGQWRDRNKKEWSAPDTMPEDMADFMEQCMSEPGATEAMCSARWDSMMGGDGNGGGMMMGGGKDIQPSTRAYSVLTIKSIQQDQRVIRGIASTPSVDRIGDIIEPLGIRYINPAPLLHQHKSDSPVGLVTFDTPTKDGVTFEAVFPRIKEPGPLRDRVETAWGEVKAGLVRAVSIGFRSLSHEVMKSGGLRYKSVDLLELSLVTVPANADATISLIRSIDTQVLAASGQSDTTDTTKPPGDTGTSTKKSPVSAQERKHTMATKKSIPEQIASYQATRVAKAARMDELMDTVTEKGETLDTQEREEYDTLNNELMAIDDHLGLLADREKRMLQQARTVEVHDQASGSAARAGNGGGTAVQFNGGRVHVGVPKMEKGTAFTRYVISLARSRGNLMQAVETAKQWHDTTPEVETVLRAAVTAGTTTNSTWAQPLVEYTNMASEFIELLRPATIIGRIPGFRRVPFNIKVPRQTSGSSVNWVGETKVKPVSALAFDQVTLGNTKVAGIVTLSDELIRFSSPSAESLVRQDLVANVAKFLDSEFVDPTKALAAGVSPASVTNNIPPVVATGTNSAALRADIRAVMAAFLADNLNPVGGVWIMTQQQALAISLMVNALGQPDFPTISMDGGTLVGMPVIASENIPASGGSPIDGYPIIFLKASEVLMADEGGVNIDVSNEASLQMDSAPDSPPTATTVTVSLWQHNLTGIRVERLINWVRGRDECCNFISFAKYV